MKSTRAAANSTSSTKKKSAAARFHAAEADEDDDDVEFVAVCGVCNEGPPKRKTRRNTQHDMMNWRAKVKSETPFRNYLDGESNCPECRTRNYKEDDGCKLITCTWFSLHKSGQYVYYCGHCGFLSPNGDPPKCPCHGMWGREAREAELEKPIDDDYEDTSTHAVSRESKQSSSASSSDADEMDSNGGSNDIDSDNTMTTASESDLNEDEDDANEVPTSSDLDVAARAIKQEPDAVASSVYDDDTVIDVTLRPQEVKSADIPVEVKAEVASSSTAPYAYDDDTDVEDSASSKEKDGEGDDIAALIFREAAEQKEECATAPEKRRKASSTSTRKVSNKASKKSAGSETPSKGKRKSLEDEEEQAQKKCSADGCTNYAKQGGVCKMHGAKVKLKLCRSEECTNQASADPHCKTLPALALNQATTGEKTYIQLICNQIIELWPRRQHEWMSPELKLALCKLLIPQKKDKDTRAYELIDVAKFIRSNVFLDEPMVLNKSPYHDDKLNAILGRLHYLKKQFNDSSNGKGLSVSSLSDQLQKRQSPLQSSQTSEPKPKRAKRKKPKPKKAKGKSTCFVLTCKTKSGECGLCIEHFKTKVNYLCSYGDCSFRIFDWKNSRCQNHVGFPNIRDGVN